MCRSSAVRRFEFGAGEVCIEQKTEKLGVVHMRRNKEILGSRFGRSGLPVWSGRKVFYRNASGVRGRGAAGCRLAGLVLAAGVMGFGQGCTVNITSSGEHATFELSPARNIYPDTSVMNGFSLLPGSGSHEDDGKVAGNGG